MELIPIVEDRAGIPMRRCCLTRWTRFVEPFSVSEPRGVGLSGGRTQVSFAGADIEAVTFLPRGSVARPLASSSRVVTMPTTSQVVTRQFSPKTTTLLQILNQEFGTWGATGSLTSSSDLVSRYRLEVIVPLDVEEGDALVASLETDRAESDFEGGGEIVSVGGGTWSPFESGA
jgi:hypothetical protein